DRINGIVTQYVEHNHLGHHLSKVVFGINEEMMMNAIYDAPVAAKVPRLVDKLRTSGIALEPAEYAELSYAFDGKVLGLAITDPFGTLERNTFFTYIKKVLKRNDSNQ